MTEISEQQISLPKDFTWRSNETITGSATVPSNWPRHLPNGIPKNQQLSPKGIPNWIPNQLTRGLPNDYRETHGYSTETAYQDGLREVDQEGTEAIIRMSFTEKQSTKTQPDAELTDAQSAYAMQLSESRSALLSRWIWQPSVELTLYRDQWHTAHTWCNWRILPPSYGQQRVTYDNQPVWRCQERKLTSLPNVTTRRCCNDVEIERIGTPHTTVSQHAEQVKTRGSRCNDVEIERIGTPHATVSQQGEQVRVFIGQRAMQKDDRSRRKIVCTKLHGEAEITITNPNHQWIPISIRRSKLHCYQATKAIDNQYEVLDGATNIQNRERAVSDQSSPTDKSNVRREASRPDGQRSGLPKTIAESMPLTDDYRLQDIFSRACLNTAQSSDSASALELGKYNHL